MNSYDPPILLGRPLSHWRLSELNDILVFLKIIPVPSVRSKSLFLEASAHPDLLPESLPDVVNRYQGELDLYPKVQQGGYSFIPGRENNFGDIEGALLDSSYNRNMISMEVVQVIHLNPTPNARKGEGTCLNSSLQEDFGPYPIRIRLTDSRGRTHETTHDSHATELPLIGCRMVLGYDWLARGDPESHFRTKTW